MEYSLQTHQGKRKNNQDYAGIFMNESELLLIVLCDGLGGHQGGDTASEMTVSQIGNTWKKTNFTNIDEHQVQKWLDKNINRENQRIYEYASKYPDLEGMGTTLVASVILKDKILISNIGDSRAYIYNGRDLTLITEDHSFVSELQRKGELTAFEAKNHYKRNALTRSLGVKDKVNVDYFETAKTEVDMLLLNSDGLSNVVTEEEIIEVLSNDQLLIGKKAEQLIQLAVDNEGTDNITVVLVDFTEKNLLEKRKAGENE